jgi:hypothetical protein
LRGASCAPIQKKGGGGALRCSLSNVLLVLLLFVIPEKKVSDNCTGRPFLSQNDTFYIGGYQRFWTAHGMFILSQRRRASK